MFCKKPIKDLIKEAERKSAMRMKDIMEMKGIMISDLDLTCPAENGNPRSGRVRKEMKIYSPSDWGNSKFSTVGLEVSYFDKEIEVQFLTGSMPCATNLFWALLGDRDIRRLILEYQKQERKRMYKIWNRQGVSGCEDIFMTFGHEKGGFSVTKTIRLCHISQFERLNEGFGNKNSKMYIGDFVELVSFMGLTEDMNVKSLRKKAGVKYIRPRYVEEIQDFTTTVSKIL